MAKGDRKARAREARMIRQRLARITPANCHTQLQSPLFSALPGELRNYVFSLALEPEVDPRRCYQFEEPVTEAEKRPLKPSFPLVSVNTALLSTCRLVYFETNTIPLRTATLRLTYGLTKTSQSDTKDSRDQVEHSENLRFADLTSKNQHELSHVQILAPTTLWIDEKIFKLQQFTARRLTIVTGWFRTTWHGISAATSLRFLKTITWNARIEELEVQVVDRRLLEDIIQDMRQHGGGWTFMASDYVNLLLTTIELYDRPAPPDTYRGVESCEARMIWRKKDPNNNIWSPAEYPVLPEWV